MNLKKQLAIISLVIVLVSSLSFALTISGSRPKIAVYFNESIDINTIDPQLIQLPDTQWDIGLITSSPRYFFFRPSIPLEDGYEYTFSIDARSLAGFQGERKSVSFDTDFTNMSISIVLPPGGHTPNQTFDVAIETGRSSDCRWNTVSGNIEFDSTLNHGFNGTSPDLYYMHIISGYVLNDNQDTIYVQCKDGRDILYVDHFFL